MATIQTINNGESGLAARTKINNNDANINAALEAAEALLTTDNANLDDFQKITDAIEAIQATLSVDDANYDTLQEIVDKLEAAETALSNLGTASSKDVGTAIGSLQENGAILANSQTVETDATGKFITTTKNTAYNKDFGTSSAQVAEGDASYLKAETYTQTAVDNALATNSTNDRARANHTGTQAIATVTGLQTALDAKEVAANKGVAGGYASLDGSGQVPASQLTDYFNKTTDTTDDITEGTAKFTTQSDINKLAGIEDNATADQTDVEIKTAYENNADTNAFTDAEKTKLSGIAAGAEVNVQADLSQTDNLQDDFVAGKSTANIADSLDKRYVTDAQQTLLSNTSGTNTGDETTLSIQTKRPLKTIANQSPEGAGNINVTKADVGLGDVDNTSDVNKPVSTAQQTALDAKLAKASNLTDVSNQQTALNNVTNVASAGNEEVLTKDTATGNAIFKAPSGGGGSSLPVGTVTYFYDAVPTGFFELNGATFDQTLYPLLYAANGNNNTLPDFRGYFIRAVGTNANSVASGSLRALQDDATAKNGLQTSRLTRVERSGSGVSSNNAYPPANGRSGAIESGANDRKYFHNTIQADSVASTDTETRPHNIALYVAIKHD